MRNKIMGLVLFCTVFFFSGCGTSPDNIGEHYSFGTQVIHEGQSEIELGLPFEIGKLPDSFDKEKSGTQVTYAGNDGHVNVVVIGEKVPLFSELALVDMAVQKNISGLENNPKVFRLQVEVEDISLQGTFAKKAHISYEEGRKAYKVVQLFVLHRDMLWRLIYQYHADDAVGEAVVKQVEGKVRLVDTAEVK